MERDEDLALKLELESMGGDSRIDDWEEPKPLESPKKNHYKPKPTKTLIYYKTCKECSDLFIAKSPQAKYCDLTCRRKSSYRRNSDYYQKLREEKYTRVSKKCSVCKSEYTSNREDSVVCSDACREIYYREKQRRGRNCLNCDKFYKGGKSPYCSPKCKKEANPPKIKHCKTCDKPLDSNLKTYCGDSCKPSKRKKEYVKTCPTCGCEFKTNYFQKRYCKPGHLPSAKEGERLRRRQVTAAKLPVESWNDIAKFVEDRPEGAHLDHIIPLNHPNVCGLHNTWNFQWLSPEDNNRKSNEFDGTVDNDSWDL